MVIKGNEGLITKATDSLVVEGLFTTITNVNNAAITALTEKIETEKLLFPPNCCSSFCVKDKNYDMNEVWDANEDIRSLKSLIFIFIQYM